MNKKIINNSSCASEIILETSEYNDIDDEFEDKSQNEVVVHLENIHKTYLIGLEGVPAIRGISLDVRRGEWLTIYGTSGGGKTSLLNILGTIDKPTKGELVICGTKINSNTKDSVLADLRLKKLGFVFQAFNLLNTMTAKENIEFPMQLLGQLDKAERTAVSLASLYRVGLENRVNHYPNQLSGGEQQRVTIARAISNKPDILLLDEPTGDLDRENTYKIIKLLHNLNIADKMTLIMVTHDVYLKNFADRVIYMRDGKIAKHEVIPVEMKKKALADLDNRINELTKPKNKIISSNSKEKLTGNTIIKKQSDYPTFSFRQRNIKSNSLVS
ncbi:P-loop containing nucleoside triphosphate hydrolase protein [Piromyces finnis]|uniref:p-loop containing nucleoside triphosphate hydrolase protein n=1 Tax=Piromyces finnis TaxID=1754191 RepID=A0A1Y1VK03_9FUNG|nr:P-loop containing nucleoside triphosphate hydrolase protein [Piromyces finnis]|eukprot:ORX57698.1 P-loop containing nucleoside triphosphate hydrolase protein [Piromyces finnis]